ncbi:MAG: phage holin family protein [Burkholderiales bacterium]
MKRLLATLVGIAKTRVELLSVEFEEEVARLAGLAFCAALSLFFIGIAVILTVALILVVFWDDRLLALGILAALFAAVGLYTGAVFLKKTKSKSGLFSQSLAEFSRDMSDLE